MYIINNNNNLIKKYKWESKTPLRIYLNYLEIIKGIYLVIMKKNEYDYYSINILEELNIYADNEIRLKAMKNNITLNKIISEVIKVYENKGYNKSVFFGVIVKWINKIINPNNNNMKEIKNLFGEKLNIFSFF